MSASARIQTVLGALAGLLLLAACAAALHWLLAPQRFPVSRVQITGNLKNTTSAQIEKALQSAGAGWANVVQLTTFLVHSQDIARFYRWREREYPRMFPDGKFPPNTLLVIDRLVQEQFLIEIQTIAAL